MCNVTLYPLMYTVSWESKITGKSGMGNLRLEFIEAKRLIKQLNKTYPEVHHKLILN